MGESDKIIFVRISFRVRSAYPKLDPTRWNRLNVLAGLSTNL